MNNGEGEQSGYNRPPYNYVDGDANLTEVVTNAGLDPTTYATKEFFMNVGLPAMYELLSDGEIQMYSGASLMLNPSTVRSSAYERHGEFYEKMESLKNRSLHEPGKATDDFNRLARYCGKILALQMVENDPSPIQIPDIKVARPSLNPLNERFSIRFDNYHWEAKDRIAKILEYGPGFTGRVFIDYQLIARQYGFNNLQYITISNGPFINQYLMDYMRLKADQSFGTGFGQLMFDRGIYGGREDGMLQGSENLIEQTSEASKGEGYFDALLATGVHNADPHELMHGLINGHSLVRPGGKLFVVAPLNRVENHSTTYDEHLDIAKSAGFKLGWNSTSETGSKLLGKNTISGLAVLEK